MKQQIIHYMHNRRIAIWGVGKRFYKSTLPFLLETGLDKSVCCLVDNNSDKHGQKILISKKEYTIISPNQLGENMQQDMIFLITPIAYREIIHQISDEYESFDVECIPGVFLESLWQDAKMMSVEKQPFHYRKNKAMRIPKTIHTFWFSDNPLPQKYKECLESWRLFCPDYEIRIWNLSSYDAGDCRFFWEAIDAEKWAFASDFARVDVIYRFGGIYMDLDVELIKPLDDLLYNDAYMSFESLDRVECGSGLGATPHNHILGEIRDEYMCIPFVKNDGSFDQTTCPVRYSSIMNKHGLKPNGSFQDVEGITVYPFESLTAKSYSTGRVYKTELTYSIHHHEGSWLNKETIQQKLQRYEEIEKLADRMGL